LNPKTSSRNSQSRRSPRSIRRISQYEGRTILQTASNNGTKRVAMDSSTNAYSQWVFWPPLALSTTRGSVSSSTHSERTSGRVLRTRILPQSKWHYHIFVVSSTPRTVRIFAVSWQVRTLTHSLILDSIMRDATDDYRKFRKSHQSPKSPFSQLLQEETTVCAESDQYIPRDYPNEN
jgi:hypothetical protein